MNPFENSLTITYDSVENLTYERDGNYHILIPAFYEFGSYSNDRIDFIFNTGAYMINFYNEPPYARQLMTIVGNHGAIPQQLMYQYTKAIVTALLISGFPHLCTNWRGIGSNTPRDTILQSQTVVLTGTLVIEVLPCKPY